MDLMGKFEGYNVYRVSSLVAAMHEDDCIYVTPAGNMYLWGTCVGVVDMITSRIMDFEVPEQIQRKVDALRTARKKRAEDKAKKEAKTEEKELPPLPLPEEKELPPLPLPEDFFERIGNEVSSLLDSVGLKKEKKKEVYSYEFN